MPDKVKDDYDTTDQATTTEKKIVTFYPTIF